MRKVVLATNIAETSLTIEGIRLSSIAPQGARVARFDARTGLTRLVTQRIVRHYDAARGRAGRLAPGICLHLPGQRTGVSGRRRKSLSGNLTQRPSGLLMECAAGDVTIRHRFFWLGQAAGGESQAARRLLLMLGALEWRAVKRAGPENGGNG